MDKKRGFLLGEETIKILIALIGLAFLAFFLYALYGVYFGSAPSEEIATNGYDFKQRSVKEVVSAINYANTNTIVNRKCRCEDKCEDYARDITDSSNSVGIPDALLLLSLMMQESSCDPTPPGAGDDSVGLMQTHLKYNCGKFGLPTDKDECKNVLITDSSVSISAGANELKEKYNFFSKGRQFKEACTEEYRIVWYYEWEAALRGYNGWGCYSEVTDRYVPEVMERYSKLAEYVESQ